MAITIVANPGPAGASHTTNDEPQTAKPCGGQGDGDEDEDEVDTEHAPVLHRYGRRVMFQVWKNGTTLGLHSQHAPDTPLSTTRDGFSDAAIGGARWRVFSTWDAGDRVLVQVSAC